MEITPDISVTISDPFWDPILQINREVAIIHQWQMLEQVGSVDNFRIVAGDLQSFRKGYFYTDSDVHKWAEAASHILRQTSSPMPLLEKKLSTYIDLVARAQATDGYLFTYNQFHFPSRRWANLSIEHELYCLGHLIEAGVAHSRIDPTSKLLKVARKAADLIVDVFLHIQAKGTPGHPEVELALLKLHELTHEPTYLELAHHFIARRGKTPLFGLKLIKQNADQTKRAKYIKADKAQYFKGQKAEIEYGFMETTNSGETKKFMLRSLYQFITGKYFQENKPFLKRKGPEGHAVRFGYFQAAVSRYARLTSNSPYLENQKQAWQNFVRYYMYITGGVGSLPLVEGFGRRYELPNESAYCETCAAIAHIFWAWEMFLADPKPEFLDIIELQLYNAVLVGMGNGGDEYFYRNVLFADHTLTRKKWYQTPCCPSNISRLLAQLGEMIYMVGHNTLNIAQYIGNTSEFYATSELFSNSNGPNSLKVTLTSDILNSGSVNLTIVLDQPQAFTVNLRIPYWANQAAVSLNGQLKDTIAPNKSNFKFQTASGLKISNGRWYQISRMWNSGDNIDLSFSIDIRPVYAHPKVQVNRSKVAFARGPIIYCMESPDNPAIEIPHISIPSNAISSVSVSEPPESPVPTLQIGANPHEKITLIPYYQWANRGPSAMRVWIPYKTGVNSQTKN